MPMVLKNKNPIIIEDDEEDILLIRDVALSLDIKNDILIFTDARAALKHFREVHVTPFFILCDVNMPAMDGFKLRESIIDDNALRLKLTPFIFLTTSQQPRSVNRAYSLNVQGYFTKPDTFNGLIELFNCIVSYWNIAVPPDPMFA